MPLNRATTSASRQDSDPGDHDFPVGLPEIRAAQKLLEGKSIALPEGTGPVAIRTPLVYSDALSQQLACRVWLKLENLQRTGSYKVRGAFNNIANLSPETRSNGLVTASAGNHAQGVAAAAAAFGVADRTTIFVPVGTPKVKQDNTRAFGVEVRETGESFDHARESAYSEAASSGRAFVEPFDDWNTIAGQGTVGLEIAEDLPECRAIFVPVGGGGLISGIALAAAELLPGAKVIGAQAAGCAAMILSLETGVPTALPEAPSTQIADGIKVSKPGTRTFAVVSKLLGPDSIVPVPDIETVAAAADLMVYAKMIAEGAGAISIAALREIQQGRVPAHAPFLQTDDVVAVISGGNIDPSFSWRILYEQTVPNLITLRVAMPDRPGELLRMLVPIAKQHVNIIDVDVNRLDSRPRIGERIVELCVAVAHQSQADALISSLNASGYRVLVSRWQDPEVERSGFTIPSAYSEVRSTIGQESAIQETATSFVPAISNGADLRIEQFLLTDAKGRTRAGNIFLPGEPIFVEIEIRNAGRHSAPTGIRTGFFANVNENTLPDATQVPELWLRHGPFMPRRSPFRYASRRDGPKSERFAGGQKFFAIHELGNFRAVALVDVDGIYGPPAGRRLAFVDYEIATTVAELDEPTFEDEFDLASILVNKKHPLPRDYIPAELRVPNVVREGQYELRPEVATAVEFMFAEAKRQGINLRLISGYRSWSRQQTLYEETKGSAGLAVTERLVARPGFSEHQTGLAVDIGDSDNIDFDFHNEFAATAGGVWLEKRAMDFGFHLRYPEGRESVTGFAWESWHFRFVGKSLARELLQRGLTLEEHFGVEGGDYLEGQARGRNPADV